MGKPGIGGTTTNSSPAPAASSVGHNLTDGRVNAGGASTLLASAVPVMVVRLPDPALSLVSVPGADDQALAGGPSSRRASPSVQSLEIPSALTIASGAPVLAALARERQALSDDAPVQPTEAQMQAIANARPGALATASAGSSGAGCRRLE